MEKVCQNDAGINNPLFNNDTHICLMITAVYPLILTLELALPAQQYFDGLRKAHFPAERNYLNAHLTLFHNLPQAELSIINDIEQASGSLAPLTLCVDAIVSTGNGTAYKITSQQLSQLHNKLQKQWQQWLIPQDKQKLWPHITVQNKVSAEEAKKLQKLLKERFEPFEIIATGLSLWEYRGGPWKFVKTFPFKD